MESLTASNSVVHLVGLMATAWAYLWVVELVDKKDASLAVEMAMMKVENLVASMVVKKDELSVVHSVEQMAIAWVYSRVVELVDKKDALLAVEMVMTMVEYLVVATVVLMVDLSVVVMVVSMVVAKVVDLDEP